MASKSRCNTGECFIWARVQRPQQPQTCNDVFGRFAAILPWLMLDFMTLVFGWDEGQS